MANATYQTSWILEMVDKLSKPLLSIDEKLKKVKEDFDKFKKPLDELDPINLEAVANSMRGLHQRFQGFIEPGIRFQDSMLDMQAITGVTDEKLAELGASARRTAKDLGGDAAGAVEVSKLLLSQLTPELANKPKLLEEMTRNSILLSKTMGGDTAQATSVLTTAMNQYGVSFDDPILAANEMNRMMNAMSAGAKEGSAELPQLGAGLQNVGGDAKRANVQFEETISALELLDKKGKKGAEGGVALRNVLSTLAMGRFLPKDVQSEMQRYGVNIDTLSNKNIKFTERLRELQKIQGDAALITKLFGKENQLAAAALIETVDEQEKMTLAISGTNTTVEQAKTVMSGYTGLMERGKAWISDFGISMFNATEKFVPFINGGFEAVDMLADLKNAKTGLSMIMNTKLGRGIQFIGSKFKWAGLKALGFAKSLWLTGLNALKAGGRFVFTALTGIGSFVVGLISATTAQWGLNIAMNANPIGLLVIGIVAVGAAVYGLIKYWDDVKKFLVDMGMLLWKLNPFSWMVELIEWIFPGTKKMLGEMFDSVLGWFSDTWDKLKNLFNWLKEKFGFGSDTTITVEDETGQNKMIPDNNDYLFVGGGDNQDTLGFNNKGGGSNGLSGTGSAAGGNKNINMTLEISNVFHLADATRERAEELAEIVMQKVNDKMRDALIAV